MDTKSDLYGKITTLVDIPSISYKVPSKETQKYELHNN